MTDPTNELVLFECSAITAVSFADFYDRHKGLRGARMKAQRVGGKSNGRVLIQVKPSDVDPNHLPDPPDVQALLCHIWNVPPNQAVQPDAMARPPFPDTRIDRARPELPDEDLRPSTLALNKRFRLGNGAAARSESITRKLLADSAPDETP